jgi:hypothetical protein
MEEMGFDLLRLFGCYFLFKEGDISWRRVGFMSKRDERAVGGTLPVIIVTLSGFCFCKHFCY